MGDCHDNNINSNNDLDPESIQCVDWEDIEMTISLHLDQCHLNLRETALTQFFNVVYSNACKRHNDTCSWEKVETERIRTDYKKWINPTVYQCIEKNNTFPSTVIPFNKVQPLKANKTTGTISTREEEDTGMIFLSDSND